MSICKAPGCLATRSSFHNTIAMAEGETSSEIVPYRFEPVSVFNFSDPDTSSSKSETDIREHASFMERLGSKSLCEMCTHAQWYRVTMLQGNGGCCRVCG